MEDVSTPDGVTGDHGDDGLGDASHQDLQIEDVEATDTTLGDGVVPDVAVVTTNLLIPTRTEGVRAFAAEDDHADIRVIAGHGEPVGEFEQCLGTKGIPPFRAANGQLGDPFAYLVADVGERAPLLPLGRREWAQIVQGIMRASGDHGVHGALRYRSVPELVVIDIPGGAGFVDALRAIWDTGDAAAPLDPRLPAVARQAVVDAIRPTRVVASDGELHSLPDGLPVEEGDALVMATSGASGQPKGVVLTHEALLASARATSAGLGIDPGRHSWLACLPLAHIGGLSVVTRALLTDTPLTVLPGFDADSVEQIGRSGGASHVSLVATALQRLDSSVFTKVLVGGSRPPETVEPNVVVTYGMTETGSGVVYDGLPLDDVDVALAGSDSESGGEILLRAPMLMRCYRGGDTGRVVGPDGTTTWFATGDAGHFGADGKLEVSGRLSDVINTGAEKVWPESVERVLLTHPNVADAAVWRRPDPEWGERVVAWVVPAETTPSLQELRDLVSTAIAPWAAPKELVLVDHVPRTLTGKVRRHELPQS